MMKLFKQLLTTTTTCLLLATPSQAFQVISAEDTNRGGNGTRATVDLAATAEAQFLSHLTTDVGTETFEAYSWDDSNLSLTFPGAGTADMGGNGQVYSIQHVDGVTDQNVINQELRTGRYAVSGVNYWQTSAAVGGNSTFSIELSEDIAAFGFYAYDLGDFGGELEINLYQDGVLVGTLSNTDHNFYEVFPSGETTGSALYVGIIGEQQSNGSYETFDRVEFVIVNNGGSNRDDFGFDDMTIATANQIATPALPPVNLYAD